MIIISKKRIQIILSCIIIAVFAFSFQIANHSKEIEMQQPIQKTVPTTATPVSGKTIVIDARSRNSR